MTKTQPPSTAILPAEKLNELAERCKTTAIAAKGKIAETLALAAVVQDLRRAVVPLVPQVRPLIGTGLGFRTDKPDYSDQVVADVLVEAVARGLRWTGNEFNIIGGKLYTTKEGYARLVSELPGLTDLELTPSVPTVRDGGAVVKYRATWKQDGHEKAMEREIPTRLNAGMGADAALGKATRKMLAAIHARITGSVHSFADSDAEDVEESRTPKTSMLAQKLADAMPPVVTRPEPASDHIPGVDDPDLDPKE